MLYMSTLCRVSVLLVLWNIPCWPKDLIEWVKSSLQFMQQNHIYWSLTAVTCCSHINSFSPKTTLTLNLLEMQGLPTTLPLLEDSNSRLAVHSLFWATWQSACPAEGASKYLFSTWSFVKLFLDLTWIVFSSLLECLWEKSHSLVFRVISLF